MLQSAREYYNTVKRKEPLMKKENRKMAQQRRAEERKKQEFRQKLKKILCIAIPSIAVLILIIAIIVSAVSSSGSNSTSSDNGTTEETSSSSSNVDADDTDADSAVSYSTDASLTVEDGDAVNIDYVGSIDGVEFSGGNTQGAGTDLVIGSGSYIDDFEEQLIGYHPGDVVEVNVTFPENYGNEDLNGKDALFEVTINGIYE